MTDDLILNYRDAVIYRSDLAILESPDAWLNDACIHFFLTRLSARLADSKNRHVGCCNYRFVDPSVLSFFMHQWDEEEDGAEDVLGLKQGRGVNNGGSPSSIFFLPINDNYVSNNWASPGGGIHWSLLVMTLSYDKDDGSNTEGHPSSIPQSAFLHYDSSSGCNKRAALAVSRKIHNVLETWRGTTIKKKSKEPDFQECSVPQQQNSYDCGIHTLATAEALALAFGIDFQKETTEEIIRLKVATLPGFCAEMRQRIATDIRALSKGKA